MKVLIIGASSYVGRNIVDMLSKVRDIKLLGTSREERNIEGIRMIKTDLLDSDLLEKITKVDVIINLAFVGAGKNIIKDNIKIVYNIIKAAKKNKVPNFIFLSSYEVVINPESDYSKYKLEAEETIRALFKKHTIVRPDTLYGGIRGWRVWKLRKVKIERLLVLILKALEKGYGTVELLEAEK